MTKGISHRRNEKAIATLANNIKKYRLAQNLTIQELANIIDVDYSQIGRMERGVVNPNISILFDIANALKIQPSQLLEVK
jgi:transcriptional regulator with XRE-family HTH domain